MEQIQEYLAKFRDGMPELFDKVIADCDARIHSDLEDEYDIPESPYVESHPIVQLRECIYELESGMAFSDYKINPFTKLGAFDKQISETNIKPLFGCDKILPTYEKVIKIYVKVDKDYYNYNPNSESSASIAQNIIKSITVIYITNYGRLLTTAIKPRTYISGWQNPVVPRRFLHYSINQDFGCEIIKYHIIDDKIYLTKDGEPIPDSTLPPLTYKFPKLFLNVINALRAESTDDMQKCCEYYYSRIHAKDKLDKENKQLRAECDSLKTKNKQLENENKELCEKIQVLEVDGAREKLQAKDQYIQELLMEIELLKIKNIEERRLYMG